MGGGAPRAPGVVGNLTGSDWVVAKTSGGRTGNVEILKAKNQFPHCTCSLSLRFFNTCQKNDFLCVDL